MMGEGFKRSRSIYPSFNPEKIDSGPEPSKFDVIVGRGKKCYNHAGNVALRRLVNIKADEYSACTNKGEKSFIIDSLIDQVRRNGKFVKEDESTGLWVNVEDTIARMRIAQMFRDKLHGSYKSSCKSKNNKRRAKISKKVEKKISDSEQTSKWSLKQKQIESSLFGVKEGTRLSLTSCVSLDTVPDLIPSNFATNEGPLESHSEQRSESPETLYEPTQSLLYSLEEDEPSRRQSTGKSSPIAHEPTHKLLNSFLEEEESSFTQSADTLDEISLDTLAKVIPSYYFDDEEPFEPVPISRRTL